jgi:hypothetical protein
VIWISAPFGGPEQVFRYLGRYTHRVGISNQRLISFDGTRVCFATKGGKTLTLEADEFIRRFLLHILPAGFVKIRRYGLWAAGNVKTRLELARQRLSEAASGSASGAGGSETTAAVGNLTWQQLLLKLTGRDVTRCPRCHTGRLVRHPLPAASAMHGAFAKRLSMERETRFARRAVEPSVGSCELDQLGPRGFGGGLGLKIPGQVMPDALAEGKRPSRLPAAPLVFRVEVEHPSAARQA